MHSNGIKIGFGLEIKKEGDLKVIIFYAVLAGIRCNIKQIRNDADVNIPLKHEKTHLIVEAILHSLDIKHSSFTVIGEIFTIITELIIENRYSYSLLNKMDMNTRITLEIFIGIIKTIKDNMPQLFARMKKFLENDNISFFEAITPKEKQKLQQNLCYLKDKLEYELRAKD